MSNMYYEKLDKSEKITNNEISKNISRYLLDNEDPEELINFLSIENPTEIFNLQLGENQFTSK